jgi:hypothetical protein
VPPRGSADPSRISCHSQQDPTSYARLDRDDEARTAFESLSYFHRKEYADWIVEAKREETRRRRVAKTLERLRAPGD